MKNSSKYQILGVLVGILIPAMFVFAQGSISISLPGGGSPTTTPGTVSGGIYQGGLNYSGSFVDKFFRFLKEILFALPPILVSIAGVVFMFNVLKYILKGDKDPKEKEEMKHTLLYSIIALVVLLGFWAIVGMISTALGIDQGQSIREGDIPSVIIR